MEGAAEVGIDMVGESPPGADSGMADAFVGWPVGCGVISSSDIDPALGDSVAGAGGTGRAKEYVSRDGRSSNETKTYIPVEAVAWTAGLKEMAGAFRSLEVEAQVSLFQCQS